MAGLCNGYPCPILSDNQFDYTGDRLVITDLPALSAAKEPCISLSGHKMSFD